MPKIPSRADWIFETCGDSIIKNKERLKKQYIQYMLDRTQQIFEYDGLPNTIPQKDLETILQLRGNAIITKVDGELYAFAGGLGGVLNEYYHPTIATVSNPYLKFSKNLDIGKECIVVLNDTFYQGLMPMFDKYASLLAETDISLRFACVNARIPTIIFADNDSTKEDAKTYLHDIEEGEKLGIIGGKPFFEGIKTEEYASKGSATNIKDLIELQQYLKSNWFIELGLNANYNMKRESINESESAMNDDCLLPLIDEMLKQRNEGFKKVNDLYGTNITVKLSSSWKQIHSEYHASEDGIKPEDTQGGESNEVE